jgi:glyoxylase-like metal-dependent hydrolase (beta-lactamase superfamily II)
LGDVDGFAVYCLNTTSGLVLFDAPGGDKLIPFLEARMLDLGLIPKGKLPLIKAVLLTSCDRDAISGLRALCAKTGCQVIGSDACRQTLKESISESINVGKDSDLTAWFQVRSLHLPGPGPGATAYLLHWHNKQVLISGRIPIKASRAAQEALLQTLSEKGEPENYRQALQRLRSVKPDLWLPLVPSDGQNANLYGHEWQEILELNDRMIERTYPGLAGQQ